MTVSRIGPYTIKQLVKTTSKTLVYRVQDASGRNFIAKLPLAERPELHEIERYECEYIIMQKVNDPQVARAIDYVRFGNKGAIILEECTGGELGDYVRAHEDMDLHSFLSLAIQAVKGLKAIHSAGIVHLDINPSNLLIMSDGRTVKIIDFGIAKEIGKTEGFNPQNCDFEGSLPYVSPEQTGSMNRLIDYRSDLYSLGITFYELLASVPPFQFDDRISYIHAHIARDAAFLGDLRPDLPRLISEIVHKLINKNVEDRYQTAFGLLDDLAHCQTLLLQQQELKSFPLGTADRMDRIDTSVRMLGREREMKELEDRLSQITKGKPQIALIAGPAGCGKTTLALAMQKISTAGGTLFLTASFQQSDRESLFVPVIRAIDRVLISILTAGGSAVGDLKREILGKLGKAAGVVVHLVPSLERIVGKLVEPNLEPNEKRQATLAAFRDLCEILSWHGHGLVFVFDNLNHADSGSLDLFAYLFARSPVGGMFLIGTYRAGASDDEISALLQTLGESGQAAQFQLEGLNAQQVGELVASALHTTATDTALLSEVIFRKTQGNPLLVGEFLKSLYQQEALVFDCETRSWRWDEKRIDAVQSSQNFADFFSEKFQALPEHAKHLLAQAAIIGSEFSLGELIVLQPSTKTMYDLFTQVGELIAQGMISALAADYTFLSSKASDDSYRDRLAQLSYCFSHDKIFQQAYQFIDETSRCRHHLMVARDLRPKSAHGDYLVKIVRHYRVALGLVTDGEELSQIALFCHKAGKAAKSRSAFAAAYQFFRQANDIVGRLQDGAIPELVISIRMEYFECAFLDGKVDESQKAFVWLQQAPLTLEQQLRLFEIRSFQLSTLGKLEESVQYGIEVFNKLGIKLVRNPSPLRFLIKLMKVKKKVKKMSIARIADLPLMRDPRYLTAMKVSTYTMTSALLSGSQMLFADLSMIRTLLSLTYGISPMTPTTLAGFSLLMSHKLHNPEVGHAYGDLVMTLVKKYKNEMAMSRAIGSYTIFVAPWEVDNSRMRELFRGWVEACMQEGDLFYLGQAAAIATYYPDDIRAAELPALYKKCHEQLVIAGNPDAFAIFHVYKYFWDRVIFGSVTGLGMSHEIGAERFIAEQKKRSFASGLFMYYTAEMKLAFLLGDYRKARENQELAAPYVDSVTGHKSLIDYYCFGFFTFARQYRAASFGERRRMRARMRRVLAFFGGFARIHPDNFAFIHLLLQAQYAELRGQAMEVIQSYYDRATSAAENSGNMWGAIANLLAASWHSEHKRQKIASLYLRNCIYLYERAGAQALADKTQRMFEGGGNTRQSQANLTGTRQGGETLSETTHQNSPRSHTTTGAASVALNYQEIFASLQRLSQESSLEKMLVAFAQLLLEYSGAKRLVVVLKNVESKQMYVAMNCTMAKVNEAKMVEQPISAEVLPSAVLRFVESALQPLILDDALQDSDFVADPYISEKKIHAILATPIARAGQLVGIIYLENAESKAAFTWKHEQMVNVLAHQMAATIQSALLQRDLENQVKRKTRDMVMIMRYMRQGIFMIGDGGLIEEGASHHLTEIMGAKDITRRSAVNFLFEGSDIGNDRLTQMKEVAAMVGENALSFEANQDLLVKEFTRRPGAGAQILELDWDPIIDESGLISKIMVTVRDVTHLRRLERQAEKDREDLEIMMLFQKNKPAAIAEFVAEFGRLAHQLDASIESWKSAEAFDLHVVFRLVHTQKGMSRTLGFEKLSNLLHKFEEQLSEARDEKISFQLLQQEYQKHKCDTDDIVAKLSRLYDKLFSVKLGQNGDGAQFAKMLSDLISSVKDDKKLRESLGALTEQLTSATLASLVEQAARGLEAQAFLQHKLPPNLRILGEPVRIRSQYRSKLMEVLVHLFTNALDHGIESSAVRLDKGKPSVGSIELTTQLSDQSILITIKDDGGGLNLGAIEKAARLRGIIHAGMVGDEALAELIFVPALSTAATVSETSGRGVGMDAVRAMLLEIGGLVTIRFVGERRQEVRPFAFVLSLPRHCALSSHDNKDSMREAA